MTQYNLSNVQSLIIDEMCITTQISCNLCMPSKNSLIVIERDKKSSSLLFPINSREERRVFCCSSTVVFEEYMDL